LWPQIETATRAKWAFYLEDMKMTNDDATKLTTDEMQALLAAYKGPIKKIPTGKRTRRGPSKKPGQSGSLKGAWTEALDRKCWGDQ
jgi:hypothetical protein